MQTITTSGTLVPPDGLLGSVTIPAQVVEAVAQDIENEFTHLVEASIKDGRARIRIIAPGKGASGYYTESVLQRDGPSVFTAGTKMFADHPTPVEGKARPERSIRDIVATLATDAVWESAGPVGPGLYSDIKIMPDWRERVEALAPHIGVSIRTRGKARIGEVNGFSGAIVESLERTPFTSVDFVTEPGAGGRILNELYESYVAEQAALVPKTASETRADSNEGEQQMQDLHESAVRIAKLCKLAGKSDLTAKFLEEKKTADEVAELLLEAKAVDDEATPVTSRVTVIPVVESDGLAIVKIAEARAAAHKKEAN